MLNARYKQAATGWSRASAPLGRPGARMGEPGNKPVSPVAKRAYTSAIHPLVNAAENARLYNYEQSVKSAFDAIVPTLKKVSALQHEADFEMLAQRIAQSELGYSLPEEILANAWVEQLDMRRLFAWCLFETYRRFCDDFFSRDPLSSNDAEFQTLLQECGFHTLDISPCADGRLAHAIRYVLRLPYRSVRRKSYAGALFDIEDSLDKWVETELMRFREGLPDTADSPTRYLKIAIYHYSSVDPSHEGCAAHGSDEKRAAQAGKERLVAFRQAIENTHCCGASVDCLLIGLDTDTDAIRIHVPGVDELPDLEQFLDAHEIMAATENMSAASADAWVKERVSQASQAMSDGMSRFITYLLNNNISQIEYVRNHYGEHYTDIGHAERFIGAGIGFEEVQLRNLTYFAYLKTVEEAAQDLDVGIKIFSKLNVSRGLPVPVIVRYDYHGNVPGARERALQNCQRVTDALKRRYEHLSSKGLLHTLQAVRDVNSAGRIEVLDSSVNLQGAYQ